MYLIETLEQVFKADAFTPIPSNNGSLTGWENLSKDYVLFSKDCRVSYGNGLLRFLLPNSTPHLGIWEQKGGWGEDWEIWQNKYCVFAYDWQARLFAFDFNRSIDGECLISMLDTGTGKAFNSNSTFSEFILHEVPSKGEKLLDSQNLEEWILNGGTAPMPHQCVGYKVPLFLGGADDIENTELIDISVYVPLQGQLFTSL